MRSLCARPRESLSLCCPGRCTPRISLELPRACQQSAPRPLRQLAPASDHAQPCTSGSSTHAQRLRWQRDHPHAHGAAASTSAPCSPDGPTRRAAILQCAAWPAALPWVLGSLGPGSADPTTLLNSVLGGYFLPRLPGTQGFTLLDDLDYPFTLEYPKGWVGRTNSLRSGLNISDYSTSDKLTVEVLPAPPGGNALDNEALTRLVVTATIVPGKGQEDDKLVLPARSLIKQLPSRSVDGQTYLYLSFPSETTTRSGYNIVRRNFAVAAIKRDSLYVCAASVRSDQFNKEKELLLRHIVDSFQLR